MCEFDSRLFQFKTVLNKAIESVLYSVHDSTNLETIFSQHFEIRLTVQILSFSKEEVNKLMSQGKRHFVCDEIVEAVKCFEVACLML